jgi:hypothetical protein
VVAKSTAWRSLSYSSRRTRDIVAVADVCREDDAREV